MTKVILLLAAVSLFASFGGMIFGLYLWSLTLSPHGQIMLWSSIMFLLASKTLQTAKQN